MAKALVLGHGNTLPQAQGITRWYQISGNFPQSTEALGKIRIRSAGTFSNLYLRIISNSVSVNSTFTSRKNGVNGNQTMSIAANSSGEFEDTTNTDTVVAGDDFYGQLVTGAGTGSLIVRILSFLFAASTNTVARLNSTESASLTQAVTYYRALVSTRNESNQTENQTRFKSGTAGTLKNLYVYVSSNGVTAATTVRSRKNGLDGNIAVSVTANMTGVFENTVDTDTVVAGDFLNSQIVVGTGGTTIIPYNISFEFETTNARQLFVWNRLVGIGATTDRYEGVAGGDDSESTESNAAADANFAGTARNLWIHVSANTRSTATDVALRKNAVSTALTFSVATNSSGDFEDATNSVTFVATDELNYIIDLIAGTGTFTYRTIGCTVENTESVATGRITATDSTLTYSEKVGRTTAADATLTYSEKVAR